MVYRDGGGGPKLGTRIVVTLINGKQILGHLTRELDAGLWVLPDDSTDEQEIPWRLIREIADAPACRCDRIDVSLPWRSVETVPGKVNPECPEHGHSAL